MQRYHDTRSDPLPIHSPQHETDRANLDRLTEQFLGRGGKIQKIGHQMSSAPASFTINPERSPVYAHLFAPVAVDMPSVAAVPAETEESPPDTRKHAALIMADAALGNSPKWIARKHHMTEKYVRQVARDYHITFHTQR
ncbi:hypothetical protein AO268_04155 [Pseudomonas sp. ICMP 8385]|uniref:hypothetical protein n=1 Tax=Pseudomonas sp. ICMP 8385 TaxID=1718920 RepID=UPI000C069E57|nr:hypothetical protein [Pseudomonas sp. ICMP 8385]PHN55639.1 hypothetical protein AO268_04155 [Pseudomonas sp. ICMP 8385]